MNESVFDIAARREVRENYLSRMESRHPKQSEDFREAAAYIVSDACLEDLARLKSGDYYFGLLQGRDWQTKGKKRLIFTLPAKQNMICSLINTAISIKYDAFFSESLYAGRPNRGRKAMLTAIRT